LARSSSAALAAAKPPPTMTKVDVPVILASVLAGIRRY
jgi:hypothetical protein